RETLAIIGRHIPLKIHEVPTGVDVFDWTIPNEWNIRDAYIKDSAGKRIVDFRKSNLHVVGYSVPVHTRMRLAELKRHLFSDPEHPDWIPYRTSYYTPEWGFCLAQRQLDALNDDDYEVCIDASLKPGHLTYGELFIGGRSGDQVLISCHVCHPSLCNDNLSGIAVATALAQHLGRMDTKFSYRILFVPGTIGAITWLALAGRARMNVAHGFVLTCVGDQGPPTYKCSRRGDAEVDQAWRYVLQQGGTPFEILPFSPYGYDERQYCSPGFDMPVGCFMRTPGGKFPQYHTSADDLNLVHPDALQDSLQRVLTVIDVLETNERYVNQKPYGEPKLGNYKLYDMIGGKSADETRMALLWLLNMSDGQASLLEIATRSGLPWSAIKEGLRALTATGLLKIINERRRYTRKKRRIA
ncbi:DUF4910 domain-containing protein, partial [Rhodopseudomonas palustris]|uniref:DUF4910 domain-containing protein n=2 Tax=Rhodopseudomonas TaxID=1073 RepID=UPI0005C88535